MSEQVDNIDDDSGEVKAKVPTPKAKDRESRASVRKELRYQRQHLKDLRSRLKNGENLSEDITACQGQIELLFKELQSIEEGGHTTFLEAKDMIAPKQNYAEKKENLKQHIKSVKKEITESEDSLYQPNLQDDDRKKILGDITNLKSELEDLIEEMNALNQFNHTRFVDARNESRENMRKAEEEQNLENEKNTLHEELRSANESSDLAKANSILQKIKEVESKIKSLNQPKEDIFLEQFEEKAKDPFLD